ncbi:interaptin [Hydra vulgaris]|uniref:interaptin n=1 Tax=Hydra vulgaris TaxID=6087 RepID=UPI001F5EF9C5|nr:interaptin [Hydra vulgaris]
MDRFKTKFEAEKWLHELSDEDYLFLVNLSFKIFYQSFNLENDDKFAEFKNKKEQEIALIKSKNENEKKSLQETFINDIYHKKKQIENLQSQLNEKQSELSKLKNETKEEKNEFEKKIQNLKKINQDLEDKQKEIVNTKFNKKKEIWEKDLQLQKINENNDKQLLNATITEKDNTIGSLQEVNKQFIDKIEKHLMRVEKSVKLGNDGENFFQNLLSGDSFINYRRVSHQKHKGDFVVKIRNSNFYGMLEVKNLKEHTSVSKEERDKFIKDLDDNHNYSYAMLVSLNGGFPESCEELKIFSTSKDKLYCYIGYFAKKDIPDLFLKTAWLALDVAMEKIGAQGSDKQEFIKLLETAVKNCQNNMNTAASLEKQAKKIFDTSHKFHNDIKKQYENIFKKFNQLKSNQCFSGVSTDGKDNVALHPIFKKQRVETSNE